MQETAVRIPTPVGTGSAVQEAPALTVPMMTGLPKMPNPTAVQSDVVAHETPLSPSTSGGMACWLHAYPSLTEDNTVFHPTAKQFAVDGHDAELRRLVPAGGVRAAHERPPVVVVMMVDPAPMLPLLPTATQSAGAEQEIPVTSTALLGGLWSDQVEPLLDVLTTYGVELRLVPTPMQVVSLVQITARSCLPLGIELATIHAVTPPSVVLRSLPPPLARYRLRRKLYDVAHET